MINFNSAGEVPENIAPGSPETSAKKRGRPKIPLRLFSECTHRRVSDQWTSSEGRTCVLCFECKTILAVDGLELEEYFPPVPKKGSSHKTHCLRCRKYWPHRHAPADFNAPCTRCPCKYFYSWESWAKSRGITAREFKERMKHRADEKI